MPQQLSLFSEEGRVPVPTGRDAASLVLLPLAVAVRGQDESGQTVRIAYDADVDGRPRHVEVTLTAGNGQALPTVGDQMVFLGLLQLSRGGQGERRRVSFTKPELLTLMGWSDGGPAYKRLRTALERLTAMTISVHSSLTTRDGRPYGTTYAMAHLIDRFELGEGYGGEGWVAWGDLVHEALDLDDFKRLDWGLIRVLDNPLTVQLYRLLDRVVLSGERTWRIEWEDLARALGMSVEAYARPARLRQVLEPHFARLTDEGVIEQVEYERGGTFVFHLTNYLRSQIRRILGELGVYPEAARQLVAGYDELVVISQVDCYQHGLRQASGVGYLVEAIRGGYALRYPDDEPQAFCALLEMFNSDEVQLASNYARKLGLSVNGEPRAWPLAARAVVRFVLAQGLDAERC